MSPADLRDFIANQPLDIWSQVDEAWPDQRQNEQQHWLDWLATHIERGTDEASRVYDKIQNPRMLLWLAYHAGVDRSLIASALYHAKTAERHPCSVIRALLPWSVIELHIPRQEPPQ